LGDVYFGVKGVIGLGIYGINKRVGFSDLARLKGELGCQEEFRKLYSSVFLEVQIIK